MPTVHIHKRGSGAYITSYEDVAAKETITQIKERFMGSHHYYTERQMWYTGKNGRDRALDNQSVSELTAASDDSEDKALVLFFKDLGMQVSWRLVFVLEYLGPIIIFPLVFFFKKYLYRSDEVFGDLDICQKLGFAMVVAHFVKREIESLFIHRFSNATMPLVRIPLNCGHYWVFCGWNISYYLFHPRYAAPWTESNFAVLGMLSAMWLTSQIMNFMTHVHLRNLRPRGSKERKIPTGYGFDVVSCANYFWEIVAWTCFCLITNTLTGWFFLVVATVQMAVWAVKKHKGYKKQFKDLYPKQRKAIIPFIL